MSLKKFFIFLFVIHIALPIYASFNDNSLTSVEEKTFSDFSKVIETWHCAEGLSKGIYSSVGFLTVCSLVKNKSNKVNYLPFFLLAGSVGLSIVTVCKWHQIQEQAIAPGFEYYKSKESLGVDQEFRFHAKNKKWFRIAFYQGSMSVFALYGLYKSIT